MRAGEGGERVGGGGGGGGATDSAEMNAYAFLQTTMCLFQKPEIDDYCSSLFSVRFGNFISRNR